GRGGAGRARNFAIGAAGCPILRGCGRSAGAGWAETMGAEGSDRASAELAGRKRELRSRARVAIAGVPAAELEQRSERMCERLMEADFFVAARTVMLYAPIAGEVDITPVLLVCLQSGRRAC